MLNFEGAREVILNHIVALQAESVGSLDSLGRMTTEDVIAPLNLFAFDHSAMDVYAVRLTYWNRIEPLTISEMGY